MPLRWSPQVPRDRRRGPSRRLFPVKKSFTVFILSALLGNMDEMRNFVTDIVVITPGHRGPGVKPVHRWGLLFQWKGGKCLESPPSPPCDLSACILFAFAAVYVTARSSGPVLLGPREHTYTLHSTYCSPDSGAREIRS